MSASAPYPDVQAATTTQRFTAAEKESLMAQALSLLQQRCTVTVAAQQLGLSKSTLYNWLGEQKGPLAAARHAAHLEYVDECGLEAGTRLTQLIRARKTAWAQFEQGLAYSSPDSHRQLALVERLDRMIDKLCGGMYQGKAAPAASPAASSAAPSSAPAVPAPAAAMPPAATAVQPPRLVLTTDVPVELPPDLPQNMADEILRLEARQPSPFPAGMDARMRGYLLVEEYLYYDETPEGRALLAEIQQRMAA